MRAMTLENIRLQNNTGAVVSRCCIDPNFWLTYKNTLNLEPNLWWSPSRTFICSTKLLKYFLKKKNYQSHFQLENVREHQRKKEMNNSLSYDTFWN